MNCPQYQQYLSILIKEQSENLRVSCLATPGSIILEIPVEDFTYIFGHDWQVAEGEAGMKVMEN